jgi:GNAT superfamily N-acetyltransferase
VIALMLAATRRGSFDRMTARTTVLSGSVASTIRPAEPEEAEALSSLARRSKAYWGYGVEFLERIDALLTFTAADFEAGPIWVLELDGELSGVYQIVGRPPEGELSDLWLDPNVIGRGFGGRLFRHALRTAALDGFESLLIESDPNATRFYLAMGATHVGHRRSAAGRWVPLLRIGVPVAIGR